MAQHSTIEGRFSICLNISVLPKTSNNKIFAVTIAALLWVMGGQVQAQLTGVKTIPGNYATIAAAVTDLNTVGVGAGGVTFNVAAGHMETLTGRITLTATGTMANPIVFQKAGAGANPILTSYVGIHPTSDPENDGMFCLSGSDWVTIDGIDLQESASNLDATTTMEYGYGFFKTSETDGCQNNTIKNCTITLNRINNGSWASTSGTNGSVGIVINNTLVTTVGTGLTISAASGSSSFNKFYSNTIQNCNTGMAFDGYNAPSPFDLADQQNDIGGTSPATGNTVLNFGGGGTANGSAGIYTIRQWGINCSYNTVNNNDGGGVNHGTTLWGITIQTATSSNLTCNNNNITIYGGGTTAATYGMQITVGSTAAGNTIDIKNNVVAGEYLTATSGTFYGINCGTTATTVNLINNNVSNITYGSTLVTGTGVNYLIYNASAATNVNVIGNTASNHIRKGTTGGTTIGIYIAGGTNQTVKNNFVNNLGIDGTGATSTMYGIQTTTGTIVVDSNEVRDLFVFKTTGTSALYGIYNVASPTNENFNYNNVYNLIHSGTGTTYGIFTNTVTGTRTVSHNLVHTISTAGTTVAGIAQTTSSPNIFNNKIYNVQSTATGAPTVSGILVTTLGTAGIANIYNNLIGDLQAPAANTSANSAPSVRGINITVTTASTSLNVSFNTVHLNATSSGTNFSTTALYVSTSTTATTAALTLKNNIFINNSTPAGTGLTVAYQRSSAALDNYVSTSNNNLFYAGSPGAANLIFYDGANLDQTLAAFKIRVSPRESLSVTENPNFLSTTGSNANFLHISTAVATQIESGGIAVGGITTDFDDNTRNATTPDIGGDEFSGIPIDLNPPIITYTPVTNTCSPGARTLTATITDASGIPTSGLGLPRLYWSINAPAGPFTGVTAVSLGSNQYEFTFGGSAVLGDNVYYYVVAQDNATTPNVIASPSVGASGYSANPPAAATPPTTPPSYGVQPSFTGTYTVGGGGNFTTLTAAVNYYNNTPCMTGPVVFSLLDATYPSETFPIVINQNPNASSTNTLTIRPAAGVSPTITGVPTPNGALIKILGSHVIIDGSNNGTSTRDLTISNTATTSPSVILIGSTGMTPIINVILKNSTLINGSTSSSAVVVSDGTTLATAGYFNNITIQNNSIQKAYMGIYNIAVVATGNGSGLNIFNNDLNTAGANSIRYVGIYVQGVDGATVSGNNIGNFDPASAEIDRGVWVASGTVNSTISGNNISTLGYTGTGANGPTGINITPATSNANINVIGNTISGLTSSGTSQSSSGITVSGAASGVTIQQNNISNIKNTNATGYGANGINLSSTSTTANVNVYNNFISDVAGNGFVGATINDNGYGIIINSGAGYNIYYNSIHMNTSQTVNGLPAAINITSGVTLAGAIDLRNNIFANSQTVGTERYSIYSGAANTVFSSINNNDYFTTGPNLGFLGSNRSNISAWQTATGQDASSISQDPNFIGPMDLHINPAGTPVEGAATPIGGITTDFDGNVRNATTPDIGGDEGNFILLDLSGPGISYPDIPNSICVDAISLSAQIADVSSVNTTAGTKPRLWFKKSTEMNVLPATNTSASNGWKYVEASNSSSPFTFNINYALLTSAVVAGDVIEYFVVAQDQATTPNVGTNSATYTSTPTSVALGAGAFPVSGTKSYSILTSPVTISSVSAPDQICISGDVTLSLTGDPSTGASYQWQSSPAGANTWTNIPGATTSTYVLMGVTASTDYRAVISCGGVPIAASPSSVATVNVSSPMVLSTTPGTECGPGPVSVALGATGSMGATLNWYDVPTGGTSVGTGTTFNTPPISSTTTYYVSASDGGTSGSVGAPSNGQNTGYTLEAGLLFDVVASSMTLNGVYIYPVGTGAGVVNIELRNSGGSTLESLAFNTTGTTAPGIKTFVPLNWTIPSGTGYFLDMTSRTGLVASLVRDGNADIVGGPIASNPFMTLPGVMTITSGRLGNTGTSTSYYFFYDWQVSTGCETSRTPVVASILPSVSWYQDSDGDSYGNPAASLTDCVQPMGYVADNTDCDDADPLEKPGQTWYKDADGDDYSDGTSLVQCTRPANHYVAAELTATTGDCNDNNGGINPGATETCNGIDDDCDMMTDEGVTSTFYQDSDMDGFGNPAATQAACSAPMGYVADNTDCNDADPLEKPGQTWYKDADGDDYSDGTSLVQCTRPANHYVAAELTATTGDCNDNNGGINPGATETCNGIDDDCDMMTDEGVTSTYYQDSDMDGFGNPAVTQSACSAPMGYVADNTDCDDADPLEKPGQTWYKDADGDDYSDGTSLVQCLRPANHYVAAELTATAGDCNDNNASIHPGAAEICNAIDDDCSGTAEAATNTWNGTGNGSTWDDANNWSDDIVPLECQNVVIPTGFNVNVPTGFTGKGLTLDVATGALLTVPVSALLNIQP